MEAIFFFVSWSLRMLTQQLAKSRHEVVPSPHEKTCAAKPVAQTLWPNPVAFSCSICCCDASLAWPRALRACSSRARPGNTWYAPCGCALDTSPSCLFSKSDLPRHALDPPAVALRRCVRPWVCARTRAANFVWLRGNGDYPYADSFRMQTSFSVTSK